jgi:hypothetical protein
MASPEQIEIAGEPYFPIQLDAVHARLLIPQGWKQGETQEGKLTFTFEEHPQESTHPPPKIRF